MPSIRRPRRKTIDESEMLEVKKSSKKTKPEIESVGAKKKKKTRAEDSLEWSWGNLEAKNEKKLFWINFSLPKFHKLGPNCLFKCPKKRYILKRGN